MKPIKKNYILICARKGSKGIKNKNLKKIGKYSLIEHAINIANKVKNNFISVSSDSKIILDIAKKKKVDFLINRPSSLAKDGTPEINVWKHFVKKLKDNIKIDIDYLIILPPTSPLRTIVDINKCINKYKSNKFDLVIMGYKTNQNPYFNMVERKSIYVKIVNKMKKTIFRRQDAPKVYNISTACYVINVKYLLKTKNIYQGRVGLVEIPLERSIDIDNKLDLEIANFIYNVPRQRI